MSWMNPLDLTHAPILQDLLELDFGLEPRPEDLHNDYSARAFVDDGTGLAFIFRRGADGAEISLVFEDAVLLESAGRFGVGATLDIWYRGRYVVNDVLVEQHGARRFYYLDFIEEDFSVTLAAVRVTAQLTPAPA